MSKPTLPLVIGHRGSPRRAPENSLAGFALAFEEGADMVELDVRLNRDGTPMVFHDDTLNRMCGRLGRLDQLSDEECRTAHIGKRYGMAFRHETIPTLRDALHEVAAVDGRVNVEIKERQATAPVVALIQKLHLHDNVLISAFDWRVLDDVATLDAGIATAALYQFHLAPHVALRHRVRALHPYFRSVLPGHIALAHTLGLTVNAWTVNTPGAWRRLMASGVDGLVTDTPGELRRFLKAREHAQGEKVSEHLSS